MRRKPTDAQARVRHLILIDAANVMARLEGRLEEGVSLFSRRRDREPLLGTVQSLFASISFGELSVLEPEEQLAASEFHELLGELRFYLHYTEDMPGQLERRVALLVGMLRARHDRLNSALTSEEKRRSQPATRKPRPKRGAASRR